MNQEEWKKTFLAELGDAKFQRVEMVKLAEEVRKRGKERAYWHEHILPKEAADRLFSETDGDYAQIWHAHCGYCFSSISPLEQTEPAFYAESKMEWLCQSCFLELLFDLDEGNKQLL